LSVLLNVVHVQGSLHLQEGWVIEHNRRHPSWHRAFEQLYDIIRWSSQKRFFERPVLLPRWQLTRRFLNDQLVKLIVQDIVRGRVDIVLQLRCLEALLDLGTDLPLAALDLCGSGEGCLLYLHNNLFFICAGRAYLGILPFLVLGLGLLFVFEVTVGFVFFVLVKLTDFVDWVL